MAIIRTGSTVEDPISGSYWYGYLGEPASLGVTEGSEFVMVAGAGHAPELVVGLSGVTIDGAGSAIVMQGNGEARSVHARIGAVSGGAMAVTDGAVFRIQDLSSAPVTKYDNSEWLWIDGQGGPASLTVDGDGSTVAMIGGAPEMVVGLNGNSTATFTNGAKLHLENVVADPGHVDDDNHTNLVVGRGADSTVPGVVTFDASTGIVDAASGKSAALEVGVNGHGRFVLGSASAFTVTGGWDSAYVEIGSGFGRTGEMILSGMSSLTIDGPADSTGMSIGDDRGTGAVQVLAGSRIDILNAAQLAYLDVGVDSWDSHGTLSIGQGGDVLVASSQDAETLATVGSQGTGLVDVAGIGSTLTLRSEDHVGLSIGMDGGSGTMHVEAGAVLLMESTDADGDGSSSAYAAIGAYGGTGDVTVDNASWTIRSRDDGGLHVGTDNHHDGGDAGNGTLTVASGGRLGFETVEATYFSIGGGSGSQGSVVVASGGRIDLDVLHSHDRASMRIATGAGGSGSLLITGANSVVRGVDYIGIGFIPGDPYGAPGGSGSLIINDGGALFTDTDGTGRAGLIEVGAGSRIGGRGGLLVGDLELESGGSLDLRDGQVGSFTQQGDLGAYGLGNSAAFEFGAAGNDRFETNGWVWLDDEITITLASLNGYKFAAGEVRTLITAADGIDGAAPPRATVTGQHSDFSYYAGLDAAGRNFRIEALNSGAVGGTGVVDFSTAGGTVANFWYDATTGSGYAWGGRFGTWGGYVHNVDLVLGTNLGDSLRVTTAGNGSRTFRLDGRGGADDLLGGAGADVLDGGRGMDRLNGGAGADVMRGGADNDTYVVDNAMDLVDELTGGGGTGDLVQSSVSFNLGAGRARGTVENLTLLGKQPINGIGNAAANVIVGNIAANTLDGGIGADSLNGGAGNDLLKGGLGNDRLAGGAGRDAFFFHTALNASANRDTITDFVHGQDRLFLENAVFTRLHAGALNAASFRVGVKALDGNDYVVYNKATGILSYDVDGSGARGAIPFAVLINKPTLTASDFLVI